MALSQTCRDASALVAAASSGPPSHSGAGVPRRGASRAARFASRLVRLSKLGYFAPMSGIRRWVRLDLLAPCLIAAGLTAALIAPVILFIELFEWLTSSEWRASR